MVYHIHVHACTCMYMCIKLCKCYQEPMKAEGPKQHPKALYKINVHVHVFGKNQM